ncbi:MAG: hypothetical protein GC150_15615 [Rhizobiales bacterium]|nr:hypothetical protein [Hyphomicrobiales bacterium]
MVAAPQHPLRCSAAKDFLATVAEIRTLLAKTDVEAGTSQEAQIMQLEVKLATIAALLSMGFIAAIVLGML